MAKIGTVVFFIGIAISIIVAMYAYYEFQPNFIRVSAGEPVVIGNVKYVINFEEVNKGSKDTRPENSFIKIGILAENIGQENTRISGGQFYLLDKNDKKYQASYGKFSSEDLLLETLEPNKPKSFTTQFDAPFDEKMQYKIGVTPRKEQSSRDIGIICILNC